MTEIVQDRSAMEMEEKVNGDGREDRIEMEERVNGDGREDKRTDSMSTKQSPIENIRIEGNSPFLVAVRDGSIAVDQSEWICRYSSK